VRLWGFLVSVHSVPRSDTQTNTKNSTLFCVSYIYNCTVELKFPLSPPLLSQCKVIALLEMFQNSVSHRIVTTLHWLDCKVYSQPCCFITKHIKLLKRNYYSFMKVIRMLKYTIYFFLPTCQ